MKLLKFVPITLLLTAALALPAFAITEAEVEAAVNASSEEAVAGNVLIWFLCAVSFLKVSQKIDSIMASLGINVGHTGGSMVAEALIATRGITTVAGIFGGGSRRTGGAASGGDGTGSAGTLGFLKGGLAGIVSRRVTNDAVKTATTVTSAVSVAQSRDATTAIHSVTGTQQKSNNAFHSSVQTQAAQHTAAQAQSKTVSHTAQSTASSTHKVQASPAFKGVGLGGAIFARSLLSGGSFANDVIGKVATGSLRSTGSITGDMAVQSLMSYMGYTALGENAADIPAFSNVEIGGGRITGIETASDSAEGLAFGMYHADQYTAPQGEYTKVHSADGSLWYKQYAQDAVERKPYNAPDGTVAYHESIVKRLPDPPKRKDRL